MLQLRNSVTCLILILRIAGNSCNWRDEKYIREVARKTSPDELVDAVVLVNTGGGALGQIVRMVYIVSKDEKVEDFDDYLVTAIRTDKVSISWPQSRLLEVEVTDGSVNNFQDKWYGTELDERDYIVDLRLNRKYTK